MFPCRQGSGDAIERPSAGAPDAALSASLYGMSSADAALLLLGTQFSEVDQCWHTLDASSNASFAPVAVEELGVPCAVPTTAASVFASHVHLPLPDNVPGVGTVSGVHRFTLNAELAATLNRSLHDAAVRRRHEGRGVRVSNVNGFHTEEELFHPEGTRQGGTEEGSLWYARVQDIVVEALRLAHQCAGDEAAAAGLDAAGMLISGWLNVSGRGAFNALHEHGECATSAVYFVDDGQGGGQGVDGQGMDGQGRAEQGGGGDADGCGEGCGAPPRSDAQGGDLLLRTQLRPFTHEYGYLGVAPLPGTLLLFPGYMPHAVLPRRQASDAAAMDGASSLRISVACNVQCAAERRGHLGGEARRAAEAQPMQLGRACRLVRIMDG